MYGYCINMHSVNKKGLSKQNSIGIIHVVTCTYILGDARYMRIVKIHVLMCF